MDEDTGKRTKVLKYGRTRREALLALLGAGAGLGAGLALAPIVSAPITNPPTIGRLSSDFLSLIPRSTRPAGIPSSSMWVRDTGDLMLYDGADDVLVGPGAGAPSDASYVTMASEAELSAESVLGTGVIMAGTTASRPSAGVNGRLFWSTDEGILYRDNASVWQKSAVRDYADLDAKPIGVIEVFNVGDYGTFSAAVAAATAAGSGTIHVPVGTWPVTTNETVPLGIRGMFDQGAILQPDGAITVTFNGTIDAGNYQIFDPQGGAIIAFGATFEGVVELEW